LEMPGFLDHECIGI